MEGIPINNILDIPEETKVIFASKNYQMQKVQFENV